MRQRFRSPRPIWPFAQLHLTQGGAAPDKEIERGGNLFVVLGEIEDLERLLLADKRRDRGEAAVREVEVSQKTSSPGALQGTPRLGARSLDPRCTKARGMSVPRARPVPDRNKDGHEHLLREVVDGERGSASSASGAVCFGHRFVALMLVGERRFLLLFAFATSLKGMRRLSFVAVGVEKRERDREWWRKNRVLFFSNLMRFVVEGEAEKSEEKKKTFFLSLSLHKLRLSRLLWERKAEAPYLLLFLLVFFSAAPRGS